MDEAIKQIGAPLHPYRICNTLYAIWEEKKRGKAWRFGKIIVNLQLENKD